MLIRFRTLLLALANLRGSVLRQALFLVAITLLWISAVLLLPGPIRGLHMLAAAAGPALTLGGYLAGMLWPYWRANWMVRLGAVETAAAALWLWLVLPPLAAAALTWQPVLAASTMILYHERRSIFGKAEPGRPQAGDRFPEFDLANSAGTSANLAGCLADGPVLFLFYRGDW